MAYEINTTRGRYVMRLTSARPATDARFEEALLGHLDEHALPVAQLMKTPENSSHAISKTVELSLFQNVPGRPLAVFEVAPEHTRQVGAFLAAMHLTTRNFQRVRRNHTSPSHVSRTLERLLKRPLPDAIDRDARTLGYELVGHLTPRRCLPKGVVHGDLFIGHARFDHGELRSVLGFGGAASGVLAFDLAVALVDWGFSLDKLQVERAAALVAGYESLRPLEAVERGGLFELACFAATRCAIMHMAAFEIGPRTVPSRYRDYRHFMRRLSELRSLGAQHFRDRIFGRAARERYSEHRSR